MADVPVSVETEAMRQVAVAMRRESDGKELRRDLIRNFRTAITPGISAVQGKLRAMPGVSPVHSDPPLGSFLAGKVKSQINLTGTRAGVRINIPQTPTLRGFKLAARRLNRESWRHPVFKRDNGRPTKWVVQVSPIKGYFDETLDEGKAKYRAAVLDALAAMARRLIERTRT